MDLLNVYNSSTEESEVSGSSNDRKDPDKAEIDQKADERQSFQHFTVVSSSAAAGCSNESVFVRSVPHVRGNWAGHVLVDLEMEKSADLEELVGDSVNALCYHLLSRQRKRSCSHSSKSEAVSSELPKSIVRHEDLHLSLSRPFVLQLASIESFVRDLQSEVALTPAFTVVVRCRKHIMLVNDEGTRNFWCWPVDTTPSLLRLIESINLVMGRYRQPTYYDPPSFHISVASVAGNMMKGGRAINKKARSWSVKVDDDCLTIHLDSITCTFGTTKKFDLRLGSL